MNDKIKRMMIYNCIVSIITLMVLIGFSIIFLREVSANIHDIGKIGIDDSILKKDGKLTNEEYRKMKLHPV
ncbi:response regulator RpfG family c-di-GMP phosphodiesterase [Clostridium punense]|uniref:Response regulator RpfG family c-di-GMP phosphodiesterase n=1 Tax=Clostridium punense TaxID=1054297 RepID=A0ABS4K1J2_9CLOT|nr:hypothetical protein [Clostridium punense]MBP2020569.1 response regulator RpfG family c-di-GMP phosphodiesterase [Clostridium punense]